jgi:hypothetical protein
MGCGAALLFCLVLVGGWLETAESGPACLSTTQMTGVVVAGGVVFAVLAMLVAGAVLSFWCYKSTRPVRHICSITSSAPPPTADPAATRPTL